MSTVYMSQLSTLPLMEGEQDQSHFPAFTLAKDPPILFPFVINSTPRDHQEPSYGDHHLRQQLLDRPQQFNDHMLLGGSNVFPTVQSIGDGMIQRPSYDPYGIPERAGDGAAAGKWAPAKLKIVRRAGDDAAARKPRRRAQACEDQQSKSGTGQSPGVIRVCSDCNTTKTPLWRSGPCGPKSLCNACGIRQRKARRAMEAAAANGGVAPPAGPSADVAKLKKEKRPDGIVDRSLPFKKRCKMVADPAAAAAKPACADIADSAAVTKKSDRALDDDLAIGLSKNQTFFRAPCPHDEITDAAILLMTLSCGLVRS